MKRAIAILLTAPLFLVASVALAQEVCPRKLPKGSRAKRQLAGQWFERGQRAVELKRFDEAVRAYRCSMRIVEHPFTAYNLALAAEKADDGETAIEGYRRYLALSPQAKDRSEVEAKIASMQKDPPAASKDPPPPIAEAPPPPIAEARPPPPSVEPPAPPPAVIAPPPLPIEDADLMTPGLVTIGAGAAIGIAAIVLNVVARGRADESRAAFGVQEYDRAEDLNGEARAMAYSSYAAFGVAGAAMAAGGIMLLVD